MMRALRGAVAAISLVVLLAPLPGAAQSRQETLADIRAQVTQLGDEMAALKAELMSTGAVSRPGGATILERLEAIELELMRLTGRTEDLELRVNRVVADGTNRLGDLEFRIVELEGGDVSAIGSSAPLGGDKPAAPAPAVPAPQAKPAASDQATLDRAREVLGQGDFRTAEDLLASFAQSFPDSELSGEALFLRGEALEGLGDQKAAAHSYLEGFSSYPAGPQAAQSLFRLGRALGRLGQVSEACITLAEVGLRYPGDPAEDQAYAERQALQCP